MAFVTSCGDRAASAPPDRAIPPVSTAPHGVELERLACNASVATRSVTCTRPSSGLGSANADIILGGQGTYITLASSNVGYNAGTSIFSFDVTVKNLIPQGLGTIDGSTADGTGLRVFFQNGPTVTGGTGSVSVANPTGVGTFTGTNQPYFQFASSALGGDGILAMNEVSSAVNWQLNVDPTVTAFAFTVYLSANVQYPNGYVDIAGSTPFMLQSGTQSLTGTARTAVGNPVASATVTFASSAPAVATVDANTGVVTGVGPGIATITATSSTSTTGTTTVQICPNLAVGESYVTSGAAAGSVCLGGVASATEYTVIPSNSSSSAAVALTMTGTNIQAVTGPPTPNLAPGVDFKLSSATSIDAPGAQMRVASGPSTPEFGAAAYSENAQFGAWSDVGRATNLVRELTRRGAGGPHVDESDDAGLQSQVDDSGATSSLPPTGVTPATGGRERLMWYPSSGLTSDQNAHVATSDVDRDRTSADDGANDNTGTGASESATASEGIATMAGTPVVGDLLQYNTNFACSGSPSVRTGMVRSVSTRAVMVADTANPAGGFTTAQYDSIGLEFDTIAYQVDAANFGTPTDVDANGRVVLFFTRAVNELSPPATTQTANAFFTQKDVFTSSECSNGNAAEIIYEIVPDPTGAVNSNVRTVSSIRGLAISSTGHELAKLINEFGRHQRGAPFEATWLDESLGAFAEELMFYRTSVGLAPKQNVQLSSLTTGPNASRRVAAFNTYANSNFTRFRSWLQRPDTTGVAGTAPGTSSLASRGFAWAFLRYASDRAGAGDPTFVQSLVTASDTGLANIGTAIGTSANTWIRDFVGAMYADDNAFTVGAALQTQSWNFRSVFGGLGGFPLLTRPLTNTVPLTLSYAKGDGASAYGRAGVAASTFATITLNSGGAPPPANVQLMIIRTK